MLTPSLLESSVPGLQGNRKMGIPAIVRLAKRKNDRHLRSEKPSARDAARAFRAEAERTLEQFTAIAATDPLPLPPPNAVSFYVVTDSATLRAGPIPTSRLIAGDHPLAELGNTAQAAIAAMHEVAP